MYSNGAIDFNAAHDFDLCVIKEAVLNHHWHCGSLVLIGYEYKNMKIALLNQTKVHPISLSVSDTD